MSCSNDDDEKDDLYNNLYDSLVKAKKDLRNTFTKNLLLHESINLLEKENNNLNILVEKLLIESKTCCWYETYKANINELTKALQVFSNSKNKLNDILDDQKKKK